MRALGLVLCSLVLVGCPTPEPEPKPAPPVHTKTQPERDPRPQADPQPKPDRPEPVRVQPRSWKSAPPGTEIVGAPPPTGTEQFCQRPDGTKHGPFTSWYADGTISEQGEFQSGKKHGTWEMFDVQGRRSEGSFKDGVRHGHWFTPEEDGSASGQYVDGIKDGKWIYRSPEWTLYEWWEGGEVVRRLERRNRR